MSRTRRSSRTVSRKMAASSSLRGGPERIGRTVIAVAEPWTMSTVRGEMTSSSSPSSTNCWSSSVIRYSLVSEERSNIVPDSSATTASMNSDWLPNRSRARSYWATTGSPAGSIWE